MRHPARLTALAVFGTLALTGCGLRQTTFDDAGTVDGTVTAVRFDADAGAVTLRGRPDVGQVTVHRRVTYWGNSPPAAASSRFDAGTLVLGPCGPHCDVAYSVDVPAAVPVTGRTDAGAVDLTGVGPVSVTTGSGAITLTSVAGPVQVRTDNGAVVGRGLGGGAVTVDAGNGRVDLVLHDPQDVRVHADNGEVAVAVPAGAYRVTTASDKGERSIGVPDDPAGTHQIDLTTDKGAIVVRRN